MLLAGGFLRKTRHQSEVRKQSNSSGWSRRRNRIMGNNDRIMKFMFNEGNKIMAKKKVCVSFDYDNDKRYKYLLEAWDANPEFGFVFKDETPGEINTNSIGRIKAGLTSKINDATHTLFIVGAHANQPHKDRGLIGFTNWINFEAHQSIQSNNCLAVVKLEESNSIPQQLTGKIYSWITSFTEKNVIAVLNHSSK